MTEDEEMYRLMNEEDPWYMGPDPDDSEDDFEDDEDREYKRTSDKKKKSK